MAIQPRDRSFIWLSFARFGLSEPLHVFLRARHCPNEFFDAELSAGQLSHPSLRASIRSPLERVPVDFRDDAARVGRTWLLSRGGRSKERERRKGAGDYTPHGGILL